MGRRRTVLALVVILILIGFVVVVVVAFVVFVVRARIVVIVVIVVVLVVVIFVDVNEIFGGERGRPEDRSHALRLEVLRPGESLSIGEKIRSEINSSIDIRLGKRMFLNNDDHDDHDA